MENQKLATHFKASIKRDWTLSPEICPKKIQKSTIGLSVSFFVRLYEKSQQENEKTPNLQEKNSMSGLLMEAPSVTHFPNFNYTNLSSNFHVHVS